MADQSRTGWSSYIFSYKSNFYILGGGTQFGFRLASVIFCVIALAFWGTLFVKNTSWVMIQRLLKEPKVIILVMLTIFNLIIDFHDQGPHSPQLWPVCTCSS